MSDVMSTAAARATDRPLHVCYLCNEYPPASLVGGVGIFVQTIARALVRAGHRATVIGLYNQPEERRDEWDAGVHVIRLSARSRYLKLGWLINRRRVAQTMADIVEAEGVAVVEAPDYEGMFWLSPAIRAPKVVRIHGGEVYFRRLLGEELKWRHWLAESQSIRQADAIAAVTRYAWQESRRLFGLHDREASILPNPVDCARFAPARSSDAVPGRILYSGTFIRKKGVLDLFTALRTVFEQVPDAHIVCVGADAADRRTGARSTQQLALELLPALFHSRVHFTGRLPHEQVAEYVRSAHVCVYPSHLETQGIVWVEAMACAKPIVASNTATGPEVIQDGVTGLLCHPSDHAGLASRIVTLLRDDQLATRLGGTARDVALSRFALDVVVPANITWYRGVAAR